VGKRGVNSHLFFRRLLEVVLFCFGLRIALGLDKIPKGLGMSCKEWIFHAFETAGRLQKRFQIQFVVALLTSAQMLIHHHC
jgi:hypothetical protein